MSSIILNFRIPKGIAKAAAGKALEAFSKHSGLDATDAALGRGAKVKHIAFQLPTSTPEASMKSGILAFGKKLTDAQRRELIVDVDFDQTGETCCYALVGSEVLCFDDAEAVRQHKEELASAPLYLGDRTDPYAIVRFGSAWPGVIKRLFPVFERMLAGNSGTDCIKQLIEEADRYLAEKEYSYRIREFAESISSGSMLGPFDVEKDLVMLRKEKNAIVTIWRLTPERWSVAGMEDFMNVLPWMFFNRTIAKSRNALPDHPEVLMFNVEDVYYRFVLKDYSSDSLWHLETLVKSKDKKLTDRMQG